MKNIRDAIWGFVVGDALGVPYEFSTREMMKEKPAVDMVGYGTYNQPPGTWSDDSSMMLCVLENRLNGGGVKDLAELFLRWFRDDYMTPHGELFDIGVTTSNALTQLMNGVKPSRSFANDEYSAGNGSLMRCVPYAFEQDITKSIFEMHFENRITHRHALCSHCCIYYVKMLRAILDGKEKYEAAKAGAAYLKFGCRITDDDDDHMEMREKFKRIFDPQFHALPETEIKSTGYVLYTLEAVVWCFLNTASYQEAVFKAVNLGGDTDTIAALTGALAGLYYGYETIPTSWIEQIANPGLIQSILDRMGEGEKFLVPNHTHK